MIYPIALQSASGSLWERLVLWYQGSFFAELFDYLGERYFSVEFGKYENFSISSGAGVTARNIILALTLGIILAVFITAYTRVVLGGFVRTLLANDATSPESAKSLASLGYFRSVSIRRELTRGGSLRMVVRSAEEVKDPKKTDFTAARFYIPEDLRYRAELRFDKKGSGWLPVILIATLAIIIAAALCIFLPDVLQLADNIITVFSPD